MPAQDRQAVPRQHTQRALEFLRQGGDSFQTTKVEAVFNWGRKFSMFPYPFVTACCGMEFMAVSALTDRCRGPLSGAVCCGEDRVVHHSCIIIIA